MWYLKWNLNQLEILILVHHYHQLDSGPSRLRDPDCMRPRTRHSALTPHRSLCGCNFCDT